MALIPQEELPVLKSASDVKSVSDGAELEAELMAIAKLINSSANTGQYTVLYNHPISEDALAELEGKGYKVEQRSARFTADPETQYVISWKG